jgi:predicted DNA-binding transcriptional regulator AlpA
MKRLLDHADLRERKGIKYSTRHLRTLVAEQKFPAPLAMGGRIVWLESEIDEWIAALPRARAAAPAARVEPPIAEPAPISAVVQLPRRRIRRRRSANSEAARAKAAWISTLRFMA